MRFNLGILPMSSPNHWAPREVPYYLKFFTCIELKLKTILCSTITILLNYLHKVTQLISG